MGHMHTWWLIGFEWWGNLRPAMMWTRDGRCFKPFVLGLWIRARKHDRPMTAESQRLRRERRNALIDKVLLGLFVVMVLTLSCVASGLLTQ